ncbi:hypothetical protein GYO_1744 [Bacillus spizizenii TU-B-10]|uniref:Uncharacterized protein n=2 Tax=Bacillus spizizenii TaxID=96241 RepID=G4NVM6_BACS4|nr:hypothetical protein GYO_1744 [Bacillus spizizenii TU-B-10]
MRRDVHSESLHIAKFQKKILMKLQKKSFPDSAGIPKKIIIVCMTFKKSLKLIKNSFFTFFLFLNSAVKMPSCPTLWYDAQ